MTSSRLLTNLDSSPRKWWPALWTLRPAVLWRKGSFGSDSETGSRFAERLLTVVASCPQQGRSPLAFLVAAEAALQGSPPPSLVPAL
jgi:transposase